jgi:valyl-tRNA synthetase
MVGQKVVLPAVGREIPIIADEAVDTEFGTGAVKITPGHDPVDFEVAQRQGLPLINILNPDATMNENAGPYTGLDRFACREAILADLEKDGLLVKIEPYSHSVGHCARFVTPQEFAAQYRVFTKYVDTRAPYFNVVYEAYRQGCYEHARAVAKVALERWPDDENMKREAKYLDELVQSRLKEKDAKKAAPKEPAKTP